MKDPSKELPRDPSGSYLHLKLKRYGSIEDLKMKYAIQTWKDTPHDAEADVSPHSRSKCRQCHEVISTGSLRIRLFLQCHKGCKNSAYFHGDGCAWTYPETSKLDSIDEIVGWKDLPETERKLVEDGFNKIKKEDSGPDTSSKRRKNSDAESSPKPKKMKALRKE